MGEGEPGSLCSPAQPSLPTPSATTASVSQGPHSKLLRITAVSLLKSVHPPGHPLSSFLCPLTLPGRVDSSFLFQLRHPFRWDPCPDATPSPSSAPGGTLRLSPCRHLPCDLSRSCLLLALSQVSGPHKGRALSPSSLTPWSLAQPPTHQGSLIKSLEMS